MVAQSGTHPHLFLLFFCLLFCEELKVSVLGLFLLLLLRDSTFTSPASKSQHRCAFEKFKLLGKCPLITPGFKSHSKGFRAVSCVGQSHFLMIREKRTTCLCYGKQARPSSP